MPGGYVVRDANGQALAYVYSRANEAEAMQARARNFHVLAIVVGARQHSDNLHVRCRMDSWTAQRELANSRIAEIEDKIALQTAVENQVTLSKIELCDLLARITNMLPDLPEGSVERRNALTIWPGSGGIGWRRPYFQTDQRET